MRFIHIQTLRFFAAAAVVLFHSLNSGKAYLHVDKSLVFGIFDYGYFGVDLFFVISGFIIYYTTHNSTRGPAAFLIRRCERIVPLYWGATFAMISLAVAFPSVFNYVGWLNKDNILKSFLFVTFTDGHFPIVDVGWTLEFEMFFYLSAGLILFYQEEAWGILSAMFSILVVLGCTYHPTVRSRYYEFFTNPLLMEFIFGIIVARVLCKKLLYKWEVAAVIAATCAVFVTEPSSGLITDDRVIAAGIPAAVIVLWAALVNTKQIVPYRLESVLVVLGDASYSIYLVQVFTVPLFCKLWIKWLPPVAIDVLIALTASMTVLAGYMVYVFIERPMLRLSRKALALAARTPEGKLP